MKKAFFSKRAWILRFSIFALGSLWGVDSRSQRIYAEESGVSRVAVYQLLNFAVSFYELKIRQEPCLWQTFPKESAGTLQSTRKILTDASGEHPTLRRQPGTSTSSSVFVWSSQLYTQWSIGCCSKMLLPYRTLLSYWVTCISIESSNIIISRYTWRLFLCCHHLISIFNSWQVPLESLWWLGKCPARKAARLPRMQDGRQIIRY